MSDIAVRWYRPDSQEIRHAMGQDHDAFAVDGSAYLPISAAIEAGSPQPAPIVVGLVHVAPKPVYAPFE